MFGFVKRFFMRIFPLSVDSMDEFTGIVKSGGGEVIQVKPYCVMVERPLFADHPGLFHYMLEISAFVHGWRYVYRVYCFQRSGTENAQIDAAERVAAGIKIYLLGEQEVGRLRTRLPDIVVGLIWPDGRLMGEAQYAKLYQDAAGLKVSILHLE